MFDVIEERDEEHEPQTSNNERNQIRSNQRTSTREYSDDERRRILELYNSLPVGVPLRVGEVIARRELIKTRHARELEAEANELSRQNNTQQPKTDDQSQPQCGKSD